MPAFCDALDLARLGLSPGEGRRLELSVRPEPLVMSGERYEVSAPDRGTVLDVARMTGGGYSLRLRFEVTLDGPCMRCLEPAAPGVSVDAREVHRPGAGPELDSPYVADDVLDLRDWARDALALALPSRVLCREACAGLCAVCGANLNRERDHVHERAPDPRWAKLRELRLD